MQASNLAKNSAGQHAHAQMDAHAKAQVQALNLASHHQNCLQGHQKKAKEFSMQLS